MENLMMVGKVFFWLVIVGLMAYFSSRLLAQRAQGLSRSKRLQVVETVAVGPRRYVCLVRVDDQELCLGVTDGQITPLCTLPAAKDLRDAPGVTTDLGVDSKIDGYTDGDGVSTGLPFQKLLAKLGSSGRGGGGHA